MSVGKKLFENPSTLEFYVQYLNNNFERGIILLSDVPKRHNIMLFEGKPEEEALRKAKVNANNIKRTLEPLTVNTAVEVKDWTSCSDQCYWHNLGALRQAYETNISFRTDVQAQARNFLENCNRPIQDWNEAIQISKEYVLEEVAMLSALSFTQQPITEVYPGRLLLQEKIVKHGYSLDGLLYSLDWHTRERYPETGFKRGVKKNVGYTLYATRDYEQGEHIFTITGPIISTPSNYTVPIASDLFIDPTNEGKYLCHSCKPTAGIRDRSKVVAFSDIMAGQEIAIDYAMIVKSWDGWDGDISCRCNTNSCRGEFGSWDKLPQGLKERYRDYASEYLKNR